VTGNSGPKPWLTANSIRQDKYNSVPFASWPRFRTARGFAWTYSPSWLICVRRDLQETIHTKKRVLYAETHKEGRKVMRILIVLSVLFFHLPIWAQSTIPETYINHAWVDGVYWNQNELPGWGFFVDAQEETMFGAIYGYTNGAPTFITLQGNLISEDPLRYRGDVFSVTNNGSSTTDVGDFTWEVFIVEASPAARLTISSDILNKSDLSLIRFSYVEDDKVDMFTAADWDIVTRLISFSYADSFGITDERFVEDGITFATIFDNAEPDQVGVIGYFPPGEGDVYSMGIEFDSETMEFFVFYASDTEMFGRGWLLGDGEEPTGNGYYFHGAADTMQSSFQDQSSPQAASSVLSVDESELDSLDLVEINKLRMSMDSDSGMEPTAMFSKATVQSTFKKLNAVYDSRIGNVGTGSAAGAKAE